ncbi:MAG: glycine zipper 2TM domain-containing protein [Opitutae bacterium]|nr:glycine zipper 2TM domain-containing protein [Opitutae bacterium]
MKTTVAFMLASLALVSSAPAQIFRPEGVSGALLGGVAGAIIGNNSGSLGHNAWKGAAIGAGAGLLLGSAIGESRYHGAWERTQVPTPDYPRTYIYRDAPVTYADSADYVYERPNYATSGLLLGGLAGAIIGNNSRGLGHNAWKGAAIGAGTGLILGSIAENNARRREAAVPVVVASPAPAAAPTTAATPQNVTIINNYYNSAPATPMAPANALFGR